MTPDHRKGFTLIEMLVALSLTTILFVYLYGTLDQTKKDHARYLKRIESVSRSQRIYDTLLHDLIENRGGVHIVHEAGYDRIDLISDHSVYGIARPWVHWFVSQKDRALIRVEATAPIDFLRKNRPESDGITFFADRFASACDSLRFTRKGSLLNLLIRCQNLETILGSVYIGDDKGKTR